MTYLGRHPHVPVGSDVIGLVHGQGELEGGGLEPARALVRERGGRYNTGVDIIEWERHQGHVDRSGDTGADNAHVRGVHHHHVVTQVAVDNAGGRLVTSLISIFGNNCPPWSEISV